MVLHSVSGQRYGSRGPGPGPGSSRRLSEVAARAGGPLRWSGPGLHPDPVATGISQDSRTVRPGDVYVALAGSRWHGAHFAADAVGRGAVAVLTDPAGGGSAAEPAGGAGRAVGVPWVVVPDLRRRLGPIASWFHGDPSRRMTLLGVTGTNGKTSTAYLLRAGLAAGGLRTGLLSGIEIAGTGWSRPAVRTTMEACELQATLATLAGEAVTAAAVEVSSHGLALHRIDGTRFRAAVFTNLGRDHLDLHGDMESYFAAKAALFDPARCGLGVVGVDDEWGRRLAATAPVPVVTFSAAGRPADFRADRVVANAAGTSFRVLGPGTDAAVRLQLLGAHQVDNALGAIAALVSTGSDPADAVRGVGSLAGVPGRLDRVDLGQPFAAFVDYVHNESGQDRVFPYLRSLGAGRLIVVMGTAGNRDLGKRVPLGRAAGAAADLVVVTDDSPHTEDPAAIRDRVAEGARSAEHARVLIEPDRAAAFDLTVSLARPGDVVVVCGRGHDQTQHSAAGDRRFDDRAQLRAALERRAPSGWNHPDAPGSVRG